MECRWCEWLEESGDGVGEEAAFVIGIPDADHGVRDGVTLLPKRHVATLAELRPEAMADVLAGLSKLSTTVRQASGRDAVEIRAHRCDGGLDHVHFDVMVPDGDRS